MLYANRARPKLLVKGAKQLLAILAHLESQKGADHQKIKGFASRAKRIKEGAKTNTAEVYQDLWRLRQDLAASRLMNWESLSKLANGHPQPCSCPDCITESEFANNAARTLEVSLGIRRAILGIVTR